MLINILVLERLKKGEKVKSFSYAVRLIMLHQAGIISDKEFLHLEWYKDIRNQAAHEPLFKITNESFIKLGNPSYSSPDKLLKLTTDLLGSIWNAHYELFTPSFGNTIT